MQSQHSQAIQHRCPPNKNKIWLTVDCVQLSLNGDWFGAKAIFEVCWKFCKQTKLALNLEILYWSGGVASSCDTALRHCSNPRALPPFGISVWIQVKLRNILGVSAAINAAGGALLPYVIVPSCLQHISSPMETTWSWSGSGWTKQGKALLLFTKSFLCNIGPERTHNSQFLMGMIPPIMWS